MPSQGLTTLHDATSLLKEAVSLCSFEKLLASMCDLPLVTTDSDLPSVKLFCELALGFILEMKMQISPDTILLSLNRVSELMTIYPCLGNESAIMLQIKECRHMAVMAGGIQMWNRFLPYLDNSMLAST
jgi:hypothetical protein